MRIHNYGEKNTPVIIMLPGSFCNADTMANLISNPMAKAYELVKQENGLLVSLKKETK